MIRQKNLSNKPLYLVKNMDITQGSGDPRIHLAQQFFDEGFSPEEWVARCSHGIGCWSLHEAVYQDPVLKRWIFEVTQLVGLNGPPRSELRAKYLTPAEIKEIEDYEAEDF